VNEVIRSNVDLNEENKGVCCINNGDVKI